MYIEVFLPLPIFESFTYKVPEGLEAKINERIRVSVIFRGKKLYGFVNKIREDKALGYEPKEISGIIDKYPIVKPYLWDLARYISEYYLVSFGQALEIVVPRWVKLISVTPLLQNQIGSVREPPYELTFYQKEALQKILKNNDLSKKFLIYGVTGSGKTEIYLQVMKELLKEGKSSIYMVPEISLTPQIVERVRERFGQNVVIIHSKMTAKQRNINWNRLYMGEAKIVIGARSAIFSPVENLGAIIIDEEHENTYKNEQSPRFTTRNIAIKLAQLTNSILIVGSATPSLESYYKAIQGEFTLISLPERINKKPLPKIEIVDISKEKTNIFGVSQNLITTINTALSNNEQVLLFINKRGFATFVRCAKCFYVLKCPKCSIAITYHKKEGKLICHHCNFEIEPFANCPSCGLGTLKMLGFGSQRIEEFVKKTFNLKVIRMDSDQKWSYDEYQNAFEQLKQKEVKVLVGTQIVAKGFDFPDITVVGILGIDVLMSLKDFRSAERIFQIVVQVAGRCGRKDKEGYVFVETLHPDNYALNFAKNYDFDGFYQTELKVRENLSLPPYLFLTTITVEGKIYENVLKKITSIKEAIEKLKEQSGIECEVVGPGQPQYKKIKGMHRFYLMIKTKNHSEAKTLLQPLISKFTYSPTLRVIVDFEPSDIL